VTNDTAAAHLADAVGTPCVILYGPTAPSRFAPFGGGHRFLHAGMECDQYLRRCAGERETGACDRRCLTSITVDAVFAAAMDVWARARASADEGVLGPIAHRAQDA